MYEYELYPFGQTTSFHLHVVSAGNSQRNILAVSPGAHTDVVLLEETKICPKEMETVVWDGWTRRRRVGENSDSRPTTKQRRDSQDGGPSSCLTTIDQLKKTENPVFMQALADATLILVEFLPSPRGTILHASVREAVKYCTVLLSVGYQVGTLNFRKPFNFFLAPGRGPNAAANILAYFLAWENGQQLSDTIDSETVPRLVKDHCLPFVDIYPWPRVPNRDAQGALRLLRQAIQAVDPLIIVTYSTEASKIALTEVGQTDQSGSDFHSDDSRPGSIHLRNFDQTERQQDCGWAVVVQSIDPGSLYYSAHARPAATRVFFLSAAVAWSAASEVMKLHQQYPLSSKYELCSKLKKRMESLVGPETEFGQNLQRALEDYNQKMFEARSEGCLSFQLQIRGGWNVNEEGFNSYLADDVLSLHIMREKFKLRKSQALSPFDIPQLQVVQLFLRTNQLRIGSKNDHWKAAKFELTWLLTCGVTEGEPNSADRCLQAERLWTTCQEISSSMEDSGYLGVKKSTFLQWALGLPTGKIYFACAYNIQQVTTQIPNLLCCFLAREDQESQSILQNEEAMFSAWKNLYSWIMRRRSQGLQIEAAIQDLANLVGINLTEEDSPSEPSDGYRVLLVPGYTNSHEVTTRISLYWQDEFGRGYEFDDFTFPQGVMPEDRDDERFLVFTAGGIDIRDTFGNTLGLDSDDLTFKLQSATIPRHRVIRILADNSRGRCFENLWMQKTGIRLDDDMNRDISADVMVFPKSFFEIGTKRSLKFVSYVKREAHESEILKQLPAYPGDELWLLDQFFKEHYPDGGSVVCAHKHAVDSVWDKLQEFTQSPRYFHHPYLREVKSLAMQGMSDGDEGRNATAHLGLAIFALFSKTNYTVTRKKVSWVEGTRRRSTTGQTYQLKEGRRPNAIAPIPLPDLVSVNIRDGENLKKQEEQEHQDLGPESLSQGLEDTKSD